MSYNKFITRNQGTPDDFPQTSKSSSSGQQAESTMFIACVQEESRPHWYSIQRLENIYSTKIDSSIVRLCMLKEETESTDN